MKVVGRKGTMKGNLEKASGFLEMVIALRGDKPFIPEGFYRFKSFEESAQWSLKMITRRIPRDLLH